MGQPTNKAIILSGGEPLEADREIVLPDDAYIIAADSGLHHAADLGIRVDLVIGDMDSVDPATLAAAVGRGSRKELHPTDKDRTDLELAIDAALDLGARTLLIVGAHTGRLDHLLGAMGLFAATAPHVDEIIWTDGLTEVYGCVPGHSVIVNGRVDDGVSLIPSSTSVSGIRTEGLRWRLFDDVLPAGSTRGISNVIETTPVSVSVEVGTLLVVHERTPT
ncbi:MAG: thiamine diphosphokinase [Actinomycetota bacterium]|nr:thiamine diphosphokinase [Actinomycetota bacterium]